MTKQEFDKLTAAIRDGALTPSQMEDVVYAMHAAYVDRHDEINDQLSTSLEDFADTMVLARKNVEGFSFDMDGVDEANQRALDAHFGDVMQQVNALTIRGVTA